MLNRPQSRNSTERGDTLIELLVALVIISFAVVALVGGLMTSTQTSSTHRNLASLDSALRAFGSSVQSAVSGQPGGASTVLAFSPCATSYQVAGPMYPTIQAVNEPVSIPVMGLGAGKGLIATVGGQTIAAGTTSSSGAAVATFAVPALGSGTYPVSIGDGATSVSGGNLTIGSANSDPLAGQYTLATQITPLGGGPCASSDAQQLTLTLANLQPNSGAVDKTNVVLIDTRNVGVPGETVTPSVSPVPLGSTLTFNAIVPGGATGSVTWTFPNSPAGAACAAGNTTTLTSGSASCTVGTMASPPAAGTYTAVAIYSGDSTHSGTSAEGSGVVSPGTGNVTTSTPNSSPAQIGSTLTFTATVSSVPGITPTGSIQWSFSGAPVGAACTEGNPTTLSGGTSTCTVTPALKGIYQPTATYQPDSGSSYNSGTPGSQASVTVSLLATSTTSVTPAGSNSATTGSSIAFTATVGGVPGLGATGSVKWTFPAGTPAGTVCSGGNTTTLSSGSATCTVNSAATGTYNPTAAYQGDSNYGASSGSQSTYVVGKETPQVTVTAATGKTNNGTNGVEFLTFTATVEPLQGTDPLPTGSITWTISGGATSCSSTQGLAPDGKKANTSSATCTIKPSSSTATYNAVASYSGDSNYNPASGNGSSSG